MKCNVWLLNIRRDFCFSVAAMTALNKGIKGPIAFIPLLRDTFDLLFVPSE